MAEPLVKLALSSATPLIQNYDTIYSKTKERIKRAGSRPNSRDGDYYEDDAFDSYNVPRRSATERVGQRGGYYETRNDRGYSNNRGYDRPQTRDNNVEEVKRDFPPSNGAVYAAKGGRARSVGTRGGGNDDDYYQSDGRPSRRDYRPRYARKYSSSSYDSESSMSPPRRRQSSAVDKYKPRDTQSSTAVTTTNGTSNSKSTQSDDESSDVVSSSEDERQHKKKRGKAMLTAGLAAVATVQAATSLYASMEARDARHAAVTRNELSKEDAKKERNKARLQDVAAIGIAALGIKGAYAKWQGVQAEATGLRQHKKEQKERHKKRVQKGKSKRGDSPKRSGGGGGGGGSGRVRPGYDRGISYNNSEPDLHRSYRDGGRDREQRYIDGNPYGDS